MAWQRRNVPVLLLAAALLAAATMLVVLSWQLTFFQDTWAILMGRQGNSAHDFLTPHNEHLVVFQVALEKVLIEVFGMTSAHPEMFVMIFTLLGSATLLFVYVSRRVGPWLGLMAAVLLLFLGSAWQVQLWPFEIEFSAPIMAGLGMLLMLERNDRRGDLWAFVLIVVAIGFGSLGISFALAALADVFVRRGERGWERVWIVVVPLFLYGVWYLGWGHEAQHHLTLHNILRSPPYVFDGFASSLGSLAGLNTPSITGPTPQPDWGRPLLVALLGLLGYAKWRRPGLAPTFWPIAVAALSYWLLAGFNFIPGREASSPRYVYAGAALVLLLVAELLRGVRVGPRALWAGAALTALAVLPNLAQMKEGADWLRDQTVLTRADTGAIEIASRTVEPSFGLTPEIAGTASLIDVSAERYLQAVRDHGSPAYSPEELASAPEAGRHQADVVLSLALPLSTKTELQTYDPGGAGAGCVEIDSGALPVGGVPLRPGVTRIEVAPGPQAAFKLRRFAANEFPVGTEGAPGESTTLLRIPRDNATQPWFLQVEAQQAARICG